MFRRKNQDKTKIIVQYNAGYSNTLYIRGEGIPGYSWDKGIPLKNVKADEWEIEIDYPFKKAAFKVLINDAVYEVGENHPLYPGVSTKINPNFT